MEKKQATALPKLYLGMKGTAKKPDGRMAVPPAESQPNLKNAA